MIISMTPIRISFFGGGTDIRNFYSKSHGAVLTTAIKKHVFVFVNSRFEKNIRVSYSQTEIVNSVLRVKHQIIKQAMLTTKVNNQVEIVTIADVPGHGTGLGSSSSLAVGTLNALYAYRGLNKSPEKLAQEACKIEIGNLNKPIGKQDQYAAAYGGLRYMEFNKDETVSVSTLKVSKDTIKEMESNLLSFYINHKDRNGDKVLKHQNSRINDNVQVLEKMRDQAAEGKEILENGDLESFGRLLDNAWRLKRSLSTKISSSLIDKYYQKGLRAGALGGKLSGAGGGGFLTFYCEPRYHERLRKEFKGLKQLNIEIEQRGSEILHLQKGLANE